MDADFNQRFRSILDQLEQAGNDYAEAKAQSWQYQELKGTVLAKIMLKINEKTVSKTESLARASEEYETYIIETAKAIKKEHQAKVRYDKLDKEFEATRSLSSLEKSTRNVIGSQ